MMLSWIALTVVLISSGAPTLSTALYAAQADGVSVEVTISLEEARKHPTITVADGSGVLYYLVEERVVLVVDELKYRFTFKKAPHD